MSRGVRVDPLFRFSSVAFVGASPRNYIARSSLKGLRSIGFMGSVACVHPNAEPVAGFPAYRTLDDVPFEVEHVVFDIRADRIPAELETCAAIGVSGVTIHSDGFAEAGEHGKALQEEVASIAARSGIAVCGPNCMGLLSVHDRTATYGRSDLPSSPGGVGIVSHSGGVLNEILAYGTYRGIAFSKAVSAGNEAVCDVADFLEHLVDDVATTTIGLVLEGVRSAGRLRAALAVALERAKPVVAIKIGSSKLAARAAATHTGAIVGSADLFAALCAQYGVTLVRDIDQLCEALLVFSHAGALVRRRERPRGVAVIEISGGGGELVCDIAERAGLELPVPGTNAVRAVADVLPGALSNPVDLTLSWEHPQSRERHAAVLEALASDGGFDAVVSRISVPVQGDLTPILAHGGILAAAAQAHPGVFFAALSRASDTIHPQWRAFVAENGIAYLQGYERGLDALAQLMEYLRFRALPAGRPIEAGRRVLSGHCGLVDEVDAKSALAQLGFPVNQTVFAGSIDEAVAAAETLGYPVALKGVSPQAAHKSDLGLVALDLRAGDQVARCARDLLEKVHALGAGAGGRSGLSVQTFVEPGLEAIVGAYRDEVYGPVVVCGLGGVFAEVLESRALRLAPVDVAAARHAIESTKLGELSRGFRHLPPFATEPLAEIVARLSAWIHDDRHVTEVDFNPVILGPRGPSIVDARIVLSPD